MCDASQALIGSFYFNFRDTDKKHGRDPVLSLLTLSTYRILVSTFYHVFYSDHKNGTRQPWCLTNMLMLSDHHLIYFVIDSLDTCSNTIPSRRDCVLQFVKELVNLFPLNLHTVSQAAQKLTYDSKINRRRCRYKC